MYFTINEPDASTGEQDALRAFGALRRHAQVLAELSASFKEEAQAVTAAYRAALEAGDPTQWARLVNCAFRLARHGESVESILGLRDPERNAWRFFQQIADENADLLVASELLAIA
jgi:hypothetical protein